jgi:hypothetical protein
LVLITLPGCSGELCTGVYLMCSLGCLNRARREAPFLQPYSR